MNDKLKTIIIVNDFAHINGGAGQVALTSALGLAKQGYNVIVFSAVEPVLPTLVAAGIKVVVTGQYEILKDPNRFRAFIQGIWNFKARKVMESELALHDPKKTVVHVHSWTKALSSSVIRTAIQRGFEVVCTLHDYFSVCPNGGFFDFQKMSICEEIPLSIGCITRNCDTRSYSQKLWRVARQMVQRQFGLIPSGIKHFITVSEFSEKILLPFLPRDATITRIDNPVNIDQGECADASLSDTFMFVGRLSPEKGATMFASAANRLGVVPTFVGEGGCREAIMNICPNARITGWVSSDEVVEYLSTARVLILPSLLYETQGLVVSEAAALGIPAIVPDTCASKDLVEDKKTGLWFRGGDENDLLEKMRILLDSGLAKKYGVAAYGEYWQGPRTIERHIENLVKAYEDILSNAHKGGE